VTQANAWPKQTIAERAELCRLFLVVHQFIDGEQSQAIKRRIRGGPDRRKHKAFKKAKAEAATKRHELPQDVRRPEEACSRAAAHPATAAHLEGDRQDVGDASW